MNRFLQFAFGILAVFVLHTLAWGAVDAPGDRSAFSTVGGRILDQDGKPIAKAKVFLSIYKYTRSEKSASGSLVNYIKGKPTIITLITDTQGGYRQENIDGSCMVAAVADGYCYSRMRGGIHSPSNIEITLCPEYKIKGKVIDESGKPVQGVKVAPGGCQAWINRQEISFNEAPDFMVATTGPDGSFEIPHMPNPKQSSHHTFSLTFKKPGRAPIGKHFSSKETINGALLIVSPLECAVKGTLKLPADAANVQEKIGFTLALDKKWGGARYISVSNGGNFEITGIPPGKHTFTLTSQGYSFRPGPDTKRYMEKPKNWTVAGTTFEVNASETKTVDIVGIKGALVTGMLVDKITGKAITAAMFNIYNNCAFDDGGQGRTVVDEQGKFAVRVAPGPVKFVLRDVYGVQVYGDSTPALEFTVADGEEKDLTWKIGPATSPLNKPYYDTTATFTEPKRGAEADGLQLAVVKAEAGDVDLQGRLELNFTLKNVSATNQNIDQAHPTVDYFLCIEDQKGNQSSFGPMTGATYHPSSKLLKPGEEVVETYSVDSSRIFAKDGKYRITGARYLHRQGAYEVVSNTIELNVKAGPVR